MRRHVSIFTLTAIAFGLLAAPSIASAQWGRPDRDGYHERNLHAVIFNLRNRSRDFARRVESEMNRRQFGDRRTSGRIAGAARSFRNSADDLHDDWRDRRAERLEQRVNRVLDQGFDLDRIVAITGMSDGVQREWLLIRRELGALERHYAGYVRNSRRDERNSRNDTWGRNSRYRFPF